MCCNLRERDGCRACGSACISPSSRRPPVLAAQSAPTARASATILWLISEDGADRATRGRADAGRGRTQPCRCSLAGPSGAAGGARFAVRARPMRARPSAEKRAQVAEALRARQAGRRGADRPGFDRLAAEHPRRGRGVHAFRARLRACCTRWRRRAVHGCRSSCRKRRALAGQRCRVAGRAMRCPRRSRSFGGKRVRVDAAGRRSWFADTLRARRGRRWRPARTRACCPKPARTRSSRQGARAAQRATRWRCAASCTG